MISRISIKGFRGIREGVVEGLSQFTVLIGGNGSRKAAPYEPYTWLHRQHSPKRSQVIVAI